MYLKSTLKSDFDFANFTHKYIIHDCLPEIKEKNKFI